MNPKEKKKGGIIIFSIIIVWVSILAICYFVKNKPISYASSKTDDIQISKANTVDIEKIISENTNITTT